MNLTDLLNAGPDPTSVIQTGAIGYDCIESPNVAMTIDACENMARELTAQLEGFELGDDLTRYAVDEHTELVDRIAAAFGVGSGDDGGAVAEGDRDDGGMDADSLRRGVGDRRSLRWDTTLDRHPVVWLIEEMWMRRESAYIAQALRVGLQLGWLALERGEWTYDDVIKAQNAAAASHK